MIRAKQESRLIAGTLCSAVDTININTAMPVPVTGIQKAADMFGIREAVCYLHSYLQIQAASKKLPVLKQMSTDAVVSDSS